MHDILHMEILPPPQKKSTRKLDPIQKVQSKMSKDHKHLHHDFYDVYSPENKLHDIMEKWMSKSQWRSGWVRAVSDIYAWKCIKKPIMLYGN